MIGSAPIWLASPAWGYAPLFLISFYLIVALIRLFGPARRPIQEPTQLAPAPPVVPVEDSRRIEGSNRTLAIRSIDYARQMAGASFNSRPREAEKEWPRMHTALLSANKEFGIPMPPIFNKAVMDLECGKRLLEQTVPLLRAGHDDEAREAAQTFINKLRPVTEG